MEDGIFFQLKSQKILLIVITREIHITSIPRVI